MVSQHVLSDRSSFVGFGFRLFGLRSMVVVALVSVVGTFLIPSQGYALDDRDVDMYVYQVEWDDASFVSLAKNIDKVDVVISERLMLTRDGLEETDPENAARTLSFLKQHPEVKALAHVHNFNDDDGVREGELVKERLSSSSEREALINGLVKYVTDRDLDGISVDFENLDAETWQLMVAFLKVLRERMHEVDADAQVVVNLPLIDEETVEESEVPFVQIEDSVDKIIIMSYDQYWADSEAGPVSGMPRYVSGLERLAAVLDEDKMIVALGNYGYDWPKNGGAGESVTRQEAVTRASSADKEIVYDSVSLSPTFSYEDSAGNVRTVSYLDAMTFSMQVLVAQQRGMSAFALWRLGSEDPDLWSFLDTYPSDYTPTGWERRLLDTLSTEVGKISNRKMSSLIVLVLGYRQGVSDTRRIFFVDEAVGRMLALLHRNKVAD